MKIHYIIGFLVASVVCFFGTMIFGWLASLQVESSGYEEKFMTWPLLISMLTWYGFLVSIGVVFVNELVEQWNEKKSENSDLTDRIIRMVWLVICNVFGAYYYSFRRILEFNKKSHCCPTKD